MRVIKAENILNEFLSHILDDRFFADIQVTRAYPDAVKPTLLKKAAVAVGVQSIELDDNSVYQSVKAAEPCRKALCSEFAGMLQSFILPLSVFPKSRQMTFYSAL